MKLSDSDLTFLGGRSLGGSRISCRSGVRHLTASSSRQVRARSLISLESCGFLARSLGGSRISCRSGECAY